MEQCDITYLNACICAHRGRGGHQQTKMKRFNFRNEILCFFYEYGDGAECAKLKRQIVYLKKNAQTFVFFDSNGNVAVVLFCVVVLVYIIPFMSENGCETNFTWCCRRVHRMDIFHGQTWQKGKKYTILILYAVCLLATRIRSMEKTFRVVDGWCTFIISTMATQKGLSRALLSIMTIIKRHFKY